MRAHERNYQRSSKLSQQRFREGYWAFKVGKAEKDCPYTRPTAKRDWIAGWLKAKQEAGNG